MPRAPRPRDELTLAQKKIVEAALTTFAEQGYHGTATKEIARRAGVSEATIFKYFPTKRDLLLGVVLPTAEEVFTPAMQRSIMPVLEGPHASFEAFARALLRERLAFVRAHPRLVRILAQELPFDAELRAEFKRSTFAPFLAKMFALVERFQREGKLVDWPAPVVFRCLFSTIGAYIFQRVFMMPEAPWDEEAEEERVVAFLVRGLAPAPPPRGTT